MEIIRLLLIVVEVICCLLLIGVILLQQSKSQGMGLAFGGGMGETLFGSRAGNVLTKITVTLAMVFLANTTLLGILYTAGDERSLVEKAGVSAPLPIAQPAQNSGMMSAPQPQSQGTLFPPTDQPREQAAAAEAPAESAVMPVEIPAAETAPVAEDAPATEETVSP